MRREIDMKIIERLLRSLLRIDSNSIQYTSDFKKLQSECVIAGVNRYISRSSMLRIKLGDRREIRSVLRKMFPCSCCSSLPACQNFSSYEEYETLSVQLDRLKDSGCIGIDNIQPVSADFDHPAGQIVMWRCNECNAVFSLCVPERSNRGSFGLIE